MFRPTVLVTSLAIAACASAGVAFAADSPAPQARTARAAAPPTGTLQIVLRPQSFRVVDLPPKRSGDAPPSTGDESITTYRVFDASGTKRLGRADFLCTSLDHHGQDQQCAGTIALNHGQMATQGDADNVAIAGGSGAYAGARGTATGVDHSDRIDVTVHFIP
jgi:hypothetical protein